MVPEPVRHKQGLRPAGYGRFHVALHQSELLEPVGDDACGGIVHLPVKSAWPGQFERAGIGCQYDIVYVLLPDGEFAVDGDRTGKVAAIVHVGFGARVDQ